MASYWHLVVFPCLYIYAQLKQDLLESSTFIQTYIPPQVELKHCTIFMQNKMGAKALGGFDTIQ